MNYTILYIHTYMHACMHACMYVCTHISHDLQVIDGFYLAPLLWFQRAPHDAATPDAKLRGDDSQCFKKLHMLHSTIDIICMYVYIYIFDWAAVKIIK